MVNYKVEFMEEAIRLALNNVKSGCGGPFGTVIVKDGKIISTGTNLVTSSNDPTAHAEVIAIREACKNLKAFKLEGCDIYSSCEPCPMCLGAIYWACPDNLFFAGTKTDASDSGFYDSFIYDEMSRHWSKRKIHTVHIQHKDALTPFDAWKLKDDRIEY